MTARLSFRRRVGYYKMHFKQPNKKTQSPVVAPGL